MIDIDQLIAQCERVAAEQFPDDADKRKDHLIELLKTKLREVLYRPGPR